MAHDSIENYAEMILLRSINIWYISFVRTAAGRSERLMASDDVISRYVRI